MDPETYHSVRHEVEALQVENGIELSMLINMSDVLSNLFSWMLRVNRFSLEEFSQYITLDINQANNLLQSLKDKGIIQETGQSIQNLYELRTKSKQDKKGKGLSKSIWEKLE
jgi:predicted transcriptional regulator